MDAALSSIIQDLRRGLLGDTLLVYAGEFGRDPKMNGYGGRDHWPYCHGLLAGRSIKSVVHGSTDKKGEGKDGIVYSSQFGDIVKEALAQEPDFGKRAQLPKLFR